MGSILLALSVCMPCPLGVSNCAVPAPAGSSPRTSAAGFAVDHGIIRPLLARCLCVVSVKLLLATNGAPREYARGKPLPAADCVPAAPKDIRQVIEYEAFFACLLNGRGGFGRTLDAAHGLPDHGCEKSCRNNGDTSKSIRLLARFLCAPSGTC